MPKGDHKITAFYSGDRKYEASETVTDIDVYYPEDGNGTVPDAEASKESNGGINLADYPTGNPILVLLLVMLAIGSIKIRRFKK